MEVLKQIGKKFANLIDLKSIITLSLIFTLIALVLSGRALDEKLFLLFSNTVTGVITYLFNKDKKSKSVETTETEVKEVIE